jgi:hypothetical protein
MQKGKAKMMQVTEIVTETGRFVVIFGQVTRIARNFCVVSDKNCQRPPVPRWKGGHAPPFPSLHIVLYPSVIWGYVLSWVKDMRVDWTSSGELVKAILNFGKTGPGANENGYLFFCEDGGKMLG